MPRKILIILITTLLPHTSFAQSIFTNLKDWETIPFKIQNGQVYAPFSGSTMVYKTPVQGNYKIHFQMKDYYDNGIVFLSNIGKNQDFSDVRKLFVKRTSSMMAFQEEKILGIAAKASHPNPNRKEFQSYVIDHKVKHDEVEISLDVDGKQVWEAEFKKQDKPYIGFVISSSILQNVTLTVKEPAKETSSDHKSSIEKFWKDITAGDTTTASKNLASVCIIAEGDSRVKNSRRGPVLLRPGLWGEVAFEGEKQSKLIEILQKMNSRYPKTKVRMVAKITSDDHIHFSKTFTKASGFRIILDLSDTPKVTDDFLEIYLNQEGKIFAIIALEG